MSNNNDLKPYGATIQDVHNAANDLRKLIAECATKRELEQYYDSGGKVIRNIAGACIMLGTTLCAAYYFLTPIFIKAENYTLETKIDEIKAIIIEKERSNVK